MSRASRAQYVVGGDVARLARELIAAVRPTDTLEHAVPHERLQDRLEMSRRQPMAVSQRLGDDRLVVRMQRNVDDGRNRKQAFTRQKRHCFHTEEFDGRCGTYPVPFPAPLEPKPATPRVVSSRSTLFAQDTSQYRRNDQLRYAHTGTTCRP